MAENLKQIRGGRGLSYAELARRLKELGHPILDTGLMKIEKGERRVDVDDLVALALALGVNVSSLLLPRFIPDSAEDIELTPSFRTNPGTAWDWADGRIALTSSHEEFLRHGRPMSALGIRPLESCGAPASQRPTSVQPPHGP